MIASPGTTNEAVGGVKEALRRLARQDREAECRTEEHVAWEAAELIASYEAVLRDHDRLVRQLDVLINGEDGAAQQASLCDIVGQLSGKRFVWLRPDLDEAHHA